MPLRPSLEDAEAGAENSDYDEDDPCREEWPHNIISTKAVAYSCGILGALWRRGHAPPRSGRTQALPPAGREGGRAA